MTKAEQRKHDARFTVDGLLKDAREWSVEDWQDLHETLEALKKRIAKRQAERLGRANGENP